MGSLSRERSSRERWDAVWPAGLLLAVSLAMTAALHLAPSETAGMVAAWFPPGVSSGDAVRRIAEADGRLVTAGGMPGVWIVQSDQAGFANRLYRAGAWLVVDAEGASGCVGNGRRLPRARPGTGEASS